MIDFLKILAWFLICLCIVILAGRVYGLQEQVEQLEKVVKIEEQAVGKNHIFQKIIFDQTQLAIKTRLLME